MCYGVLTRCHLHLIDAKVATEVFWRKRFNVFPGTATDDMCLQNKANELGGRLTPKSRNNLGMAQNGCLLTGDNRC